MSPKIVDKEKRKKEIALATLESFAKKGYEATSMSQIAKIAGIGKGTIYEYFESKEEVILYAIEAWIESMEEKAEKQIEGIEDPVECLRTYVHSAISAFMSDKRVTRLFVTMFEIMLRDEALHSQHNLISKTMQNACRFITNILLDGVSQEVFRPEVSSHAEKIAINILVYLDGIGLYYHAIKDQVSLTDQINLYLDNLFRGLRTEAEDA